jgi:hypothetical protein
MGHHLPHQPGASAGIPATRPAAEDPRAEPRGVPRAQQPTGHPALTRARSAGRAPFSWYQARPRARCKISLRPSAQPITPPRTRLIAHHPPFGGHHPHPEQERVYPQIDPGCTIQGLLIPPSCHRFFRFSLSYQVMITSWTRANAPQEGQSVHVSEVRLRW